MLRHLVVCLAIASLTFAAPRPADAAGPITHTFTAVDAVEIQYQGGGTAFILLITGVLSGGSTATTYSFPFPGSDIGLRQTEKCERMAQIAMTKPGKFQLGVRALATPSPSTSDIVCKLTSVAP